MLTIVGVALMIPPAGIMIWASRQLAIGVAPGAIIPLALLALLGTLLLVAGIWLISKPQRPPI